MTCTHSDTFAHGTVQNHLHVQQRHSQRACWGVAYPGPAASTLLRSSSTCYGMQEPCLGTRTGGRPAACSLTPLEACIGATKQHRRLWSESQSQNARGHAEAPLTIAYFVSFQSVLFALFSFSVLQSFLQSSKLLQKYTFTGSPGAGGVGTAASAAPRPKRGGQCCCCSTGATVQARCQSLCRAADWKLTSVWEAVLLPGRPCMHTHALRGVLARRGGLWCLNLL